VCPGLPELSNLFGGEWPSTAAVSVVNIVAMAAGATPLSRIIQRSLRETPDKAVRGEGIRLYLASGKVVIDGSGGAAVACIGHGNQRVAAAMADQAGRMAYAHTGFFTSEPAEALADILLADEPGGLTHAFFVSSGSEAMEAAVKLARQYCLEIG